MKNEKVVSYRSVVMADHTKRLSFLILIFIFIHDYYFYTVTHYLPN
jgi:hypothetical protein